MKTLHPTPYPQVNEVLHLLLSSVQKVLFDDFVGLYLYGSLASGDFNYETSDVDFVVVTATELEDDQVWFLKDMHRHILCSGLKWAQKLEGSYISTKALRRYDPHDAPKPCLNEGKFYLARHGSDWVIQRHILRDCGIVVAGPNPVVLIDPVNPDDLRQAIAGILHEWWEPMLVSPARLQNSEYQAYAVLTMCRALYTLEMGDVVSKRVAAEWAKQGIGVKWSALIQDALAWNHSAHMNRLEEVLDLVRFTVAYGQAYTPLRLYS